MKVLVRVYKWIVISIVIQFIILIFINNVYLGRSKEIKATSFETAGGISGATEKLLESKGMKIPAGAKQIRVSFNGIYLGYVLDGKLQIIDIESNKIKKDISSGNDTLTYYRWLPDRNMIIYSLKSPDSEAGRVNIMTCDADSGAEHSYPKITGMPKGSEVTDIELSPLTNVTYVKVKVSDSQAKIYKYNIMDNLSYIMNINADTVIKQAGYSDMLLYQDSKNKLFVRDGKQDSSWAFPFKTKMALLGIDSEDKVYAGELDKENMVYKIHYGKLAVEPDKSWSEISLKDPVPPESIVVGSDGSVYEVNESSKLIYDVHNDTNITYPGKFVELIDGYIITMDSNVLKFTALSQTAGK